jgi:hypothetical protein
MKTVKTVKIWQGTTKGELMKTIYTPDELKNIDAAIPIEIQKESNILSYWLVMNYNQDKTFGRLENMKDIAKERNINLIY